MLFLRPSTRPLEAQRTPASARVAGPTEDAARTIDLDKLHRPAAAPRPLQIQGVTACLELVAGGRRYPIFDLDLHRLIDGGRVSAGEAEPARRLDGLADGQPLIHDRGQDLG